MTDAPTDLQAVVQRLRSAREAGKLSRRAHSNESLDRMFGPLKHPVGNAYPVGTELGAVFAGAHTPPTVGMTITGQWTPPQSLAHLPEAALIALATQDLPINLVPPVVVPVVALGTLLPTGYPAAGAPGAGAPAAGAPAVGAPASGGGAAVPPTVVPAAATAPPASMAELSAAIADLRVQTATTKAAVDSMSVTVGNLFEQMNATNAATTQALASVQASIDDIQATHAQLQAAVDRQQEPFKLLATSVAKAAGVTLVGAAVAATIRMALRRDRNEVAGAA
jgi:hypothetical protein